MPMPELKPAQEWSEEVSRTPPPVEIIQDILFDTSEINVVVGRSSIGKTNFVNQLAHSIANNDQKDFIGHKILSHHSVGYTGFEVDEHEFKKRNDKLELYVPASPMLWLSTPAPFFKLNATTKDDFENAFNFKVIIIDPVKYVMDGDVSDPKSVTRFLQTLQESLRKLKALAIIVLYFKKLDNRSPQEPDDLWNIKGATEWGDICSTILMLERTKQGHKSGGSSHGFAATNKDNVTLYFAKTRNAANVHAPIDMFWNRAKCMFERV